MVNQGIGERLDNFDVAKFLAIFLVVWGHVVQQSCMLKNPFDDFICQTIYTFHMPLFMGLCGFFFHKSIAKLKDYENKLQLLKTKDKLLSKIEDIKKDLSIDKIEELERMIDDGI